MLISFVSAGNNIFYSRERGGWNKKSGAQMEYLAEERSFGGGSSVWNMRTYAWAVHTHTQHIAMFNNNINMAWPRYLGTVGNTLFELDTSSSFDYEIDNSTSRLLVLAAISQLFERLLDLEIRARRWKVKRNVSLGTDVTLTRFRIIFPRVFPFPFERKRTCVRL